MFLVQTKTTLDLCMIVASCFVAVFLGFSGSWTKLEGIMNSSKFQSVLVQHLWVSVWESGKSINEHLNFIWGYSEAFKIVAGLNRIEHGFECELIRSMSTSVEPCFNVYLSVSVDFLFKVYCWIFFFFFFLHKYMWTYFYSSTDSEYSCYLCKGEPNPCLMRRRSHTDYQCTWTVTGLIMTVAYLQKNACQSINCEG